ncbi:hypothetical protein, partial [uncultured Algibacter sp.]|uniref:hypothetical protein n=1 Tax=uncultured Algibacter sp. TaxID=298659 RepID=UPI0026085633
MKKLFFFILYPVVVFGQVQIGDNIDGEYGDIQDKFGDSVSMSSDGSIIAIGASRRVGVNGVNSGSVSIYKTINGIWTQIGESIDGEAIDDYSGGFISLSADGNVVAIGAPNNDGNGFRAGHVRIYKNINDSWTQIGEDIDGEKAGDFFGRGVSLSSDGNIIAIGAPLNDGNGSGRVRIYENINDSWTQIGENINGDINNLLGWSISLSSNGAVVAIGSIGGGFNDHGDVRVYENQSGTWTQVGSNIIGELKDDYSGYSVSLSADGSIVAVGSIENDGNGDNSGHVRVYKNINSTWSQVGGDIDGEAPGDQSGGSISLSSDGNILAVGALGNQGNGYRSGHVRVYKNVDDSWSQLGGDIDGEARFNYFGDSVCLSSDGSSLIVGAPLNHNNGGNSGYARVYENVSSTWIQKGDDIEGEKGVSGDIFGISTSLSSTGKILAIGASGFKANTGRVKIYENENGIWIQIGEDIEGEAAYDYSGRNMKLCSDGNIVAIGAINNDGINGSLSGHVRIYENINGIWTQIGSDIDGEAAFDYSGGSIGLSSDGNIIAIGAHGNDGLNGENSGHVRIYKNTGGVWTQIGSDIDGEAPGGFYGISVSLSGDGSIVAIGAPDNNGNGENSGHVRIYKNTGGVWTQIGSDIDGETQGDASGSSVSLS